MLFFRAVIYLFIQNNVYLYIVYWGLAGSRLKKSMPVQLPPKNSDYHGYRPLSIVFDPPVLHTVSA